MNCVLATTGVIYWSKTQYEKTMNAEINKNVAMQETALQILDDLIASGAVAATMIVTFPGGRQWKLEGLSHDAKRQLLSQSD
jgi:hypothetical protein